jgi:hypothetical protein
MGGTGFHVPCTMLDARNAINSLVRMVVVIHVFFICEVFYISKECYFDNFPAIICTNNK